MDWFITLDDRLAHIFFVPTYVKLLYFFNKDFSRALSFETIKTHTKTMQ